MLYANLMAEAKLLLGDVLHFRNRDFRFFCSCELDLDPMTFTYKLDPELAEIYRVCENKLPKSRLSKVILLHTYYIHTYVVTDVTTC